MRQQGHGELAVRLASAAEQYRARLDIVRSPRAEQRWRARIVALRAALAEPLFESAWESGRRAELGAALRDAQTRQSERTGESN